MTSFGGFGGFQEHKGMKGGGNVRMRDDSVFSNWKQRYLCIEGNYYYLFDMFLNFVYQNNNMISTFTEFFFFWYYYELSYVLGDKLFYFDSEADLEHLGYLELRLITHVGRRTTPKNDPNKYVVCTNREKR